MAKCKYRLIDNYGVEHNYDCPHDVWEPDGALCIFHSEKLELKRDYFMRKFAELLISRPKKISIDGVKSEEETIDCIGFVFLEDSIPGRNTEVAFPITFHSAYFGGHVFFNGWKFKQIADFSGATFSTMVRFDEAVFSGETLFKKTIFEGEAHFQKANFNDEKTSDNIVSFKGAIFSGYVNFGGGIFNGSTVFADTTFHGAATFGGAEFNGRTWFNKTVFKHNADFVDVTFGGHV